ncbi:MAG: hypothetical protein HPY44_01920 [Armatimonadetes bacterium]|nr:hypothetical protein [Armatimonadota bacterium]
MNAPSIDCIQVVPFPTGTDAPAYLVRVQTGAGASGVGEACDAPLDEVSEVVEELAVQVLGRPSANRTAIWQAMCGAAGDWEGPPDVMSACLSALDAAIWDAWCASVGLPCVAVMGGRTRSALEICLDCGTQVEDAKAAHAEGVRIFALTVDPRDDAAVARVSKLRGSLGPQALLLLQCPTPAADVDEAVAWGQILDRLDPYWVEGLLPDGQWREMAQIRERIASATACGSQTIGYKRFVRPIEGACADIITPRLDSVGGPTGALSLSVMVGMRGLRMSVLPGSTPASVLAAMHISFARPEVYPLRITPSALEALRRALPGAVRDGFLHLGDEPGWSGIADLAEGIEPVAIFEA